MDILIYIILFVVGSLGGGGLVLLAKRRHFQHEIRKIEDLRTEIEKQKSAELEKTREELLVKLKQDFLQWKNEYNQKQSQTTSRLNKKERRLMIKEENLDKRYINIDNKERELEKKERKIRLEQEELEVLKQKLDEAYQEQRKELERISGMTVNEAKNKMKKDYEEEAKLEAVSTLKQIEEELREKAEEKAKEIISTSVQRIATEHVISSSVTVIDLPNDDMKGRIIGREGRNIRALENATEVDFIVDDTPEAIIVSSFDPIRREMAKLTLEKLIADGRIHPARIEEVAKSIQDEFEQHLRKIGEDTALEIGISDLNPKLYYYIGKLNYRTSYGQNVLLHSKEVALIAEMIAKELGLDGKVALRAGLLHDIGKSIDKETEGTHTELSVQLARKFGESKKVQEAIASHHMDVEFTSIEGVLIQAADSISAARPGARREILETYIKRLEQLEEVCRSFSCVSKAYALRAGREVRIIIDANETDDNKTFLLSKDISKRIQKEMEYPGQIKVTVIREVRAVEYAR